MVEEEGGKYPLRMHHACYGGGIPSPGLGKRGRGGRERGGVGGLGEKEGVIGVVGDVGK